MTFEVFELCCWQVYCSMDNHHFHVGINKSLFQIKSLVNCILFIYIWTGRGRGRVSYQAEAPRGRFSSQSFGRGSDQDYNRLRGNGFYRPGFRHDREFSGPQVSGGGQSPPEPFNYNSWTKEIAVLSKPCSSTYSRLNNYDIILGASFVKCFAKWITYLAHSLAVNFYISILCS